MNPANQANQFERLITAVESWTIAIKQRRQEQLDRIEAAVSEGRKEFELSADLQAAIASQSEQAAKLKAEVDAAK